MSFGTGVANYYTLLGRYTLLFQSQDPMAEEIAQFRVFRESQPEVVPVTVNQLQGKNVGQIVELSRSEIQVNLQEIPNT